MDFIAGRGNAWLPAFFAGDLQAGLAWPALFGFWKFFAQIGNFSRESVTYQGFCPVPFPPVFRALIAGDRASELPLFFVPGEWNFRHKGASVTV